MKSYEMPKVVVTNISLTLLTTLQDFFLFGMDQGASLVELHDCKRDIFIHSSSD